MGGPPDPGADARGAPAQRLGDEVSRLVLHHGQIVHKTRDEDPTYFSTDPDPDPAQLERNYGSGSDSGSDLKSK